MSEWNSVGCQGTIKTQKSEHNCPFKIVFEHKKENQRGEIQLQWFLILFKSQFLYL